MMMMMMMMMVIITVATTTTTMMMTTTMMTITDVVFRLTVYCDQVNSILTHVDNLIGQLVSGFQDRGMGKCVNYIIVADHGE